MPPKGPPSAYLLWLSEWRREQAKVENLETPTSLVKRGAQAWHTVSDHEKQVCISKFTLVFAYSKRHGSDIKRNPIACG